MQSIFGGSGDGQLFQGGGGAELHALRREPAGLSAGEGIWLSAVPTEHQGRVAAGEPLLAEQNIEDYFPIPVEYMPNKQTFMLQVQGESMINAGILSGDYVIVEQTPSAENGEQVVALIEDGATVKTFYREEGIIRLQPENDAYDPIILTDVTILGKVIGVIRMY